MLSNKSVSVNKHDPTGPVRTIVSKSAVNLRNILIKQKTKCDKNSLRIVFGRSLLPLIIALLSAALGMIMKLRDWLEEETGQTVALSQEDFNCLSSCNWVILIVEK